MTRNLDREEAEKQAETLKNQGNESAVLEACNESEEGSSPRLILKGD